MITILFVCTGNTCRSPMAQVMLQEELRRAGIGENQVRALSAGIFAFEGDQATEQAKTTMAEQGLTLVDHRSRRLTPRLINEAHLILGMTEEHKHSVLMIDAAAADKVFSLAEFVADPEEKIWQDVADPYGRPLSAYRRTAESLRPLLRKLVKKIREERMVEG